MEEDDLYLGLAELMSEEWRYYDKPFELLPDEILEMIADHFTEPHTIKAVSLVTDAFRRVFNRPQFIKRIVTRANELYLCRLSAIIEQNAIDKQRIKSAHNADVDILMNKLKEEREDKRKILNELTDLKAAHTRQNRIYRSYNTPAQIGFSGRSVTATGGFKQQ